ncbi:PREDICTED: general odorant-binding protein 56d-like [Habropoda laboriosa]|uniref:general odorant-binding protein 56d-like n=1 Tax=Habropoda laboriosa TaxID=597456 RepID=UPI00083CD190|nr:PREDICTED: general odorant-binding protein 56d-like [Habropoda laboriosa]
MKTIAVVFALCFVGAMALTDEQKAKLTEHKTACIAETSVDPQVVENAKKGNFAQDDEKLGCFVSCMLKKIGIMNQDGSVNEEVTRAKAPSDIPKDQVETIINKCKTATGANDCKKAANIASCFMKNKTFSVLE